jgi:hypothetical protein
MCREDALYKNGAQNSSEGESILALPSNGPTKIDAPKKVRSARTQGFVDVFHSMTNTDVLKGKPMLIICFVSTSEERMIHR